MKRFFQQFKLAFKALFLVNILAVVASVSLIVLMAFGFIPSGLWLAIMLAVVGGVDLLAALFAICYLRLGSQL